MSAIERLRFRCPECHGEMARTDELTCPSCGHVVAIRDGRPEFLVMPAETITDPLDKVKYRFKKYARFYDFLIALISPVFPLHRIRMRKWAREVIESDGIAVNIGSGNSVISPGIVNLDIYPYENVTVLAGAYDVPFVDGSIDAVFSVSVLEHLVDPEQAVREVHRILAPDGRFLVFVPFMAGFHASPDDFQRYSAEGMKRLLSDFDIETMYSPGPTSALLWIFQEWLAALLSFGSRRINAVMHPLIMLLTWPIKFLDVFMRFMPGAERIAVGFVAIARKRAE